MQRVTLFLEQHSMKHTLVSHGAGTKSFSGQITKYKKNDKLENPINNYCILDMRRDFSILKGGGRDGG